MNAEANKQLLHDIFDAMSDGRTEAMSAAMADDFEWAFPGDWAWAGTWAPKAVVLDELLRPLMAQFASYRSEADAIVAEGDRVVVQAHADAVTHGGARYDQTYCYVFTVRDGKLARVEEYCDTALAERVLEPVARPA